MLGIPVLLAFLGGAALAATLSVFKWGVPRKFAPLGDSGVVFSTGGLGDSGGFGDKWAGLDEGPCFGFVGLCRSDDTLFWFAMGLALKYPTPPCKGNPCFTSATTKPERGAGFFANSFRAPVISPLFSPLAEVAINGGDSSGAIGLSCTPLAPGERAWALFTDGWNRAWVVCAATETVNGVKEVGTGAVGQGIWLTTGTVLDELAVVVSCLLGTVPAFDRAPSLWFWNVIDDTGRLSATFMSWFVLTIRPPWPLPLNGELTDFTWNAKPGLLVKLLVEDIFTPEDNLLLWPGNNAGCENDESAELPTILETLSEEICGNFEFVLLDEGWLGLNTDPVGWKYPLTVSPGEWLFVVGNFGRTNWPLSDAIPSLLLECGSPLGSLKPKSTILEPALDKPVSESLWEWPFPIICS